MLREGYTVCESERSKTQKELKVYGTVGQRRSMCVQAKTQKELKGFGGNKC